MNSGFVDCDTAITGIFDVSVEIIGVGEVEMSNSNISLYSKTNQMPKELINIILM